MSATSQPTQHPSQPDGGCPGCGRETHHVDLGDFGPGLTGQLCEQCGLVSASY